MAAIIADFGKNQDGFNLYRINGNKAEIANAIQKLKDLGCELKKEPIDLEKSHKHWSVLIEILIPELQESEGKEKSENI